MKKIIFLILAAVLLLSAAGCSPQPAESVIHRVEKSEISIQNGWKSIYAMRYMPYLNDPLSKSGKSYDKTMPCIIMSHGFNGSSSNWANTANYLAERGYLVIAFDFCGGSNYGKSDCRTTEMTIDTEMDDLRTVVDYALSLSYVSKKNIVLFGESMGGLVTGLCLPELEKNIKAAVLYYPAFTMCSMFSEPWPDNIFGMQLSADFFESLRAYDPYTIIKDYDKPILILHGTADGTIPYSSSEKIASDNPNVTLVPLEGEDHGFSNAGRILAMEYAYEFLSCLK